MHETKSVLYIWIIIRYCALLTIKHYIINIPLYLISRKYLESIVVGYIYIFMTRFHGHKEQKIVEKQFWTVI